MKRARFARLLGLIVLVRSEHVVGGEAGYRSRSRSGRHVPPLANLTTGALSPLETCFGIGAVVRRDKPSHDVTLAGAPRADMPSGRCMLRILALGSDAP